MEEADDYTLAAEELLSRDPQMGARGSGDVWALAMAPLKNRTVYLFYTFDAREVLFLGIAAMDE